MVGELVAHRRRRRRTRRLYVRRDKVMKSLTTQRRRVGARVPPLNAMVTFKRK